MKYFPAYRRRRMAMGIESDRELSRKAGLAVQRITLWVNSRPLKREEAEKLAAFLSCPVTEIWEPDTGRPVLIA